MRELIRNLRTLPRAAWILFGGTFINRFGTFVMPFLAIYMTKQGFSPTQAGLAVSSYGAGHICAAMIGGHLADRIGRRHTIALSMFLSAIAMLALSQARTLPAILTLSFFVGLVAEFYRPAAAALLGDLVAPEQRIAAFGMYRFAINLGFAVGPATAGFLADKSFFFVFAGDAVTSFVYGAVALLFLPHGVRSSGKDEKPGEGFRVAFSDRAFVYFLAATMCMTWIEFQLHSTLPLHIGNMGYTPKTYGWLISLNGVMIVLFELAITAWTQRFPPQPLIALGYGLTGLGFALTGMATGIPMLAFTVVVWTLGEMTYAPVTGAYVTGLAPEQYRGRYMGIWHSTWSAGMILGPTMGTWIYERNQNALWITCFFVGVASAVLALLKPRVTITSMLRKTAVLLALALSLSAFARTRATSHPAPKIEAATVHGVVTSVQGNLIAIADGLVTIDATNARVIVGRSDASTVADIETGMLLFATVKQPEQANAPLIATTIAATRVADATLFGTVDAVDDANHTITMLGRMIHLDAQTSVSGEVLPNQIVQVQTESVNGRLVATSVLVVVPVVPSVHTARGVVKSIAPDTWVIEQDGKSLTLVIDAQTKIAGSPKVGDRVEVLYRVDASHANVAIAIARFEVPDVPVPHVTRISGIVTAMSSTSWTIGQQQVKIGERTKIEPHIKTGDTVDALVEKKDDGSLHAILIMKRRI